MLRFATLSLACLGVIVICGQAAPLFAAEQKVLAQTKGGVDRWVWKASESHGEDLGLTVKVEIGDEIEMEIVDGFHGFVTLNKRGDDEPDINLNLVITCREDPTTKPNAVLREVGPCINGETRLNVPKGEGPREMIRLIVLKEFTNKVFFWCAAHEQDMWGTLERKN